MNKEIEALKYGAPILYSTPIPITLKDNPDVLVYLNPMNNKEISSSMEINYLSQDLSYIKDIQVYDEVLSTHTDKVVGAIGFPSNEAFIKQLPLDLKQYLYKKLIDISLVTPEQLDNIEDMLDVQFNPLFQEDSWECKTCQAKGLDYTRACGYLPKDKRDPAPILPRVNGKRLTSCPISSLNYYVLNQASTAHSYLSSGFLPEGGGIGNQTHWFVKVSLLFKRKVAEAEQAAIKRAREN